MNRRANVRQGRSDVVDMSSIQETVADECRGDFARTAVPHMSALYNQALFLTKNPDDAKDLLQDTYLKAYRFWDKFEKGTNINGWLHQIMKNSYINQYRKKVKEPKSVEFDEGYSYKATLQNHPAVLHHNPRRDPDEVFEDEIAASLKTLPEDFKTVVMLSDLEDFTYEEIANVIAVPLGTVRSRLHRGRRLLRERLKDYAARNRCLL